MDAHKVPCLNAIERADCNEFNKKMYSHVLRVSTGFCDLHHISRQKESMSIFSEALLLLRVIEVHLIGAHENSIQLLENLKRLLWYPLKFLKIGMAEKTKSASVWAFISFAFLIFGTWFVNNSGIAQTESANYVMLACMIIPIFLVVFTLPSMYGARGISQNSISFVTDHLQSRGFEDVINLDLLKKSIKSIEDRARSRVTVLKWLVGLLWAGFMYTFTKSLEAPPASATQFTSNIVILAFLMFLVGAAYVLVWGYEASLDKLFQLVELGCNDHSHLLQKCVATDSHN